MSDPGRKAAYAASLLRGKAFAWMSAQLQHNSSLLADWETFKDLVLEVWDIDDLAKRSAPGE